MKQFNQYPIVDLGASEPRNRDMKSLRIDASCQTSEGLLDASSKALRIEPTRSSCSAASCEGRPLGQHEPSRQDGSVVLQATGIEVSTDTHTLSSDDWPKVPEKKSAPQPTAQAELSSLLYQSVVVDPSLGTWSPLENSSAPATTSVSASTEAIGEPTLESQSVAEPAPVVTPDSGQSVESPLNSDEPENVDEQRAESDTSTPTADVLIAERTTLPIEERGLQTDLLDDSEESHLQIGEYQLEPVTEVQEHSATDTVASSSANVAEIDEPIELLDAPVELVSEQEVAPSQPDLDHAEDLVAEGDSSLEGESITSDTAIDDVDDSRIRFDSSMVPPVPRPNILNHLPLPTQSDVVPLPNVADSSPSSATVDEPAAAESIETVTTNANESVESESALPRIDFAAGKSAWEVDSFHWPQTTTHLVRREHVSFVDLFNSIERTCDHGFQSLAVTGVEPGEGCSTVAICMARSLVSAGKSVLLIDGNLENSQLGDLAGLDVDFGWHNSIPREVAISESLVKCSSTGLTILVLNGRNAMEMPTRLTSMTLTQIVSESVKWYDVVILDAGVVADLENRHREISLSLDATLLVRHANGLSPNQIRDAQEQLSSIGLTNIAVAENFGHKMAG